VPVGQTIAWIVRPGEAPPADEVATTSGRKSTLVAAPAATLSTSTVSAVPVAQAAKISPKARRLASERGVDLAHVHGSGPGGEILASDILAAAESKAVAPAATTDTGSPIARLMAERTTQSWTTVPTSS
jgi:pyruvate/2-oxoglutarate dehydrogenase complex dihydrolipoamide acyltransferase (E2) component